MMFKIYITAKALADVCLKEMSNDYSVQSDWFRILRKQQKIYTIGYIPPKTDILEEDDFSDSGVIAKMYFAYNIEFIPADNYISSVKADNSKIREQPNAAFFLDIDSKDAKVIQEKYGVICQSVDNIDSSVFTDECVRFDFKKNRPVKGGWEELFEVQSKIPSNAICLIDRFLFVYDGMNNPNGDYSGEIINNGLDTVFLILSYALPSNGFCGTYHVTVVCDIKYIKNRFIFQTLRQELNERVKVISKIKGYPILVQLLAVDGEKASYTNSLTHNRQIISNYYKIDFLNGVNAIRFYNGSKGDAEYTQSVQGQLLYGTGLKHMASECPVNSINETRSTFNWILKRWLRKYEPDHYHYADNLGNSSIRNFQNRLFL